MKKVVRVFTPTPHPAYGYIFSCGLVGLAILSTRVIEPYLKGTILPFFFMAVAMASLWWGARAGILGTVLSTVTLQALFLHEGPAPFVVDLTDMARLTLFCGLSSILVWMGGRQLAANQALLEMATRDVLTGLHSRRFLLEGLELQAASALRLKSPFALLMIDVDHFKRVNDTYGHAAGDAVLKQVAGILLTRSRTGDLVARFGGEEFVVSLPDARKKDALMIAEELRSAVAHESAEGTLPITVSIGVAHLDSSSSLKASEVSAQLLRDADAALYRAKHNGRNQVQTAIDTSRELTSA